MFCTYCRDANKTNKFVVGSTNFRLEAIVAHENSEQHKLCASISERPPPEKSEAAKVVFRLKSHEYECLNTMFRNAHAIAKHHLSFKFYTVLYQLDKAKGLDVGNTYVNDKKAKEFVHHISNVSRKETLQLLANSKYISVTCDGTNDFMGEEYESLHVHSCMDGKVSLV